MQRKYARSILECALYLMHKDWHQIPLVFWKSHRSLKIAARKIEDAPRMLS
jgi:hypothetical protein